MLININNSFPSFNLYLGYLESDTNYILMLTDTGATMNTGNQ